MICTVLCKTASHYGTSFRLLGVRGRRAEEFFSIAANYFDRPALYTDDRSRIASLSREMFLKRAYRDLLWILSKKGKNGEKRKNGERLERSMFRGEPQRAFPRRRAFCALMAPAENYSWHLTWFLYAPIISPSKPPRPIATYSTKRDFADANPYPELKRRVKMQCRAVVAMRAKGCVKPPWKSREKFSKVVNIYQ